MIDRLRKLWPWRDLAKQVDIVAFGQTGDVILGLVDEKRWGTMDWILFLQKRINAYIAYWDSGQLVQDSPAARDAPITIRIYLKYRPDEDGTLFLERAKLAVRQHGIGFEFQMLESLAR